MTEKKIEQDSCCGPELMDPNCCRVEAILTVDSKGQILLPKELRENMKIDKGDKLVTVLMNANTDSPVVVLMKANNFGNLVKNFLGPVLKDIFQNE